MLVMKVSGTVAGELDKLPASIRAALEVACDGDWRRVTYVQGAGFTVHNVPQFRSATAALKALASPPAPVAKKAAKPAAKPAAKKAPAKRTKAKADTDNVTVLPEPLDVLRYPPDPYPAEPIREPVDFSAFAEERMLEEAIASAALDVDEDEGGAHTAKLPAVPHCVRCETAGHYVEACPQPLVKRTAKAPARRRQLRQKVDLEKLADAIGTERPSLEPGVNVLTSTPAERAQRELERERELKAAQVYVNPDPNAAAAFDWARVDLGETSQRMREAWCKGLPAGIGYYYLPDVLALYGLDQDLVDAALRQPEKVEVRPESFNKDKGYAVLGFHRGDVMVVLGLKEPHKPCIIACYSDSRLEHDHHRVGHTGGGGKKGEAGLPKTPKQLAVKLRGMGAEVALDERLKSTRVTYKGQDLGNINCGNIVTATQVGNDFQRMQRKIHAIDRRDASVAS